MATAKEFVVIFDFTAADGEESELSVRKGERVAESSEGEAMDGWALVEVLPQRSRSGYVPSSYLREEREETPRAVAPTPQKRLASMPIRRISDPRLQATFKSLSPRSPLERVSPELRHIATPEKPAQLLEATKYDTPEVPGKVPTLARLARCGNYAELTRQHDQFFASVTSAKARVDTKLESLYAALDAELQTVADDATDLVRRLDDLRADRRGAVVA